MYFPSILCSIFQNVHNKTIAHQQQYIHEAIQFIAKRSKAISVLSILVRNE